jgi:hypothetical protein
MRRIIFPLLFVASLAPVFVSSFAAEAPANNAKRFEPKTFILHLPGIGGELWPDRQFVRGLRQAAFDGPIEIHDWTGEDRGLKALLNKPRHGRQAALLAKRIRELRSKHPLARLVVTAHSGGTGVAVWALEQLPPDVRIDSLVLLSSALSPQYDLSAALAHVAGRCYTFHSAYDAAVLGAGTRVFGTIDGVKEDAAGKVGFTAPPSADADQYRKLVQFEYSAEWMKYDNIGDHIGSMSAPFTEHVLAPLIDRDEKPPTKPAATEGASQGSLGRDGVSRSSRKSDVGGGQSRRADE